MTAENVREKVTPTFPNGKRTSILLVLIPAALGIAAAAAIISAGSVRLIPALMRHARGYIGLFAKERSIYDAFREAVALCRPDIASYFIAMLYPYTTPCRPLTLATSFLRTAAISLSVYSVAAVTAIVSLPSVAAVLSLVSGGIMLMLVLYRADTVYDGSINTCGTRPNLKEAARSALISASASGAVIIIRTLLLLAGGLSAGHT